MCEWSGGTRKTRHLGRWRKMTKEKQLPVGEKAMKESRAVNKNIDGCSERIGLHTGTSGSKKGVKLWSGWSCGSIKRNGGDKSTSTLDSSVWRSWWKWVTTYRNDQEHYGNIAQQLATKTKENGRRDDTQREPWVDRWDTRSKQRNKSLPSMFKK